MIAAATAASWPYTRRIRSSLEAVDDVAREVRARLRAGGLAAMGFAVELCLRECLNNAVLHGNGGDATRQVDCGVTCGPKWIRLWVRDEGAGFKSRATRLRPQSVETAASGRGLRILQTYCQRIRYNRSGNEITLWLARGPAETSPSPALPPPSSRRQHPAISRH